MPGAAFGDPSATAASDVSATMSPNTDSAPIMGSSCRPEPFAMATSFRNRGLPGIDL
jgi:hypothetical protein